MRNLPGGRRRVCACPLRERRLRRQQYWQRFPVRLHGYMRLGAELEHVTRGREIVAPWWVRRLRPVRGSLRRVSGTGNEKAEKTTGFGGCTWGLGLKELRNCGGMTTAPT